MPNKEDLRVRKTKKALFDSFMKLLTEKPFDEITVNELCDIAGIRRATFYKHYSDKFDFLTAYTRLLRDRFDRTIWKDGKPLLTKDYYIAYAKSIIHFVDENWNAVHNICHSPLFPSVIAIIVEQNYRDTCERLRMSIADGMVLSAPIDVIAAMCTGGVAGCIYSWIAQDRKTDPSQIAEHVGTLVGNILNQN